jgi:hypothetical protein
MFGTWFPSSSLYRYVQNGASFRIRNNSYDDFFDVGLDHTVPNTRPVYNLTYDSDSTVGTYSLHDTIIGQNGDVLQVYIEEINWDSGESNTYGPFRFIIVGDPPATGPTLNVKVSGAWKSGKPYVKVNGAWKEATKVYVKVNGAWKESK